MMDDLTIISYNISFAESSSVAPDRARRAEEAPHLIRDECLRSRPDIIALQESPDASWGATVFGPYYVSMGTQLASHVHGHIDLLVRRDLAQRAERIALEHPSLPLPGVAATTTLSNGTRIVACSLHLPHTAEGATARGLMCESVMQILTQRQDTNCILIGDFNMRQKEDKPTENLAGGGWIDVWKASGEDRRVKFTWDSRKNSFHGPNSFEFVARFDRCYVRGNKLEARQFDLFGNQTVNCRKGDYLSDHYGVAVKVGVRPTARSSTLSASCGVQLGVKLNGGDEIINGSNMPCKDMVDLTADSGSEDDSTKITSFRKSHAKSNRGGYNFSNNDTAIGNGGKISHEEMRRLRLQKLSGGATSLTAKKSSSNGNKEIKLPSQSSRSLQSFNQIISSNQAATKPEGKQSTQAVRITTDIEPMKAKPNFAFAESDKPKRYIIYMAIREKKESNFVRGLGKCNAASEAVRNCFQMDQTRHVTLYEGNLTSDQVHNLAFRGDFEMIKIELDGWKPWDSGCCLKLSRDSENALKDLLSKIDGLPAYGGKRPCDHISIYRKGHTNHPNPEREFARIRQATMSHQWGSVLGVEIRIKLLGSSYDECMTLAACQSNRGESNQKKGATCSDAFLCTLANSKVNVAAPSFEDVRQVKTRAKKGTTSIGMGCKTKNDNCGDENRDAPRMSQTNNNQIANASFRGQVKNKRQYKGWSENDSGDDEQEQSQENAQRAKFAQTKIFNSAQITALGESKKERCLREIAKKRFNLESSSSDDDGEEMKRRLKEKHAGRNGKTCKKRKLSHLSYDSPSDED